MKSLIMKTKIEITKKYKTSAVFFRDVFVGDTLTIMYFTEAQIYVVIDELRDICVMLDTGRLAQRLKQFEYNTLSGGTVFDVDYVGSFRKRYSYPEGEENDVSLDKMHRDEVYKYSEVKMTDVTNI